MQHKEVSCKGDALFCVFSHHMSHQTIALTDSATPQDTPCHFQYSMKKTSKFFRIVCISLKYYWGRGEEAHKYFQSLCGKRGSEITYRREKKRNLSYSEVTLTYSYCFFRSENMEGFLCMCFGLVQGGKS